MNPLFENMKTDLMKKKEFFEGKNRRLSNLRLVFFILLTVFLCLAIFTANTIVFGILSAICLGVFVYLCVVHGKSKSEYKLVVSKIECIDRYIAREEGKFDELKDYGAEFLVPGHDYAADLDLFGTHSVFALYNTSHFVMGRKALADLLCGKGLKNITKDSILKRQSFIASLESSFDFLVDYEAKSNLHKIERLPQALINLAHSNKNEVSSKRILYKAAPFMWLIPLALFVLNNKLYKAAILLVILVNIIIWFISTRKYASIFSSVGKVSSQANALSLRIDNFYDDSGKTTKFFGEFISEESKTSMRSLKNACAWCALRSQPIMALILNCCIPYDLICADKVFSWSKKYGEQFLNDLDGIGSIEALMSLATVGLVSKQSCFPVINDEKQACFSGTDMTHPLLAPSSAVSNSIEFDSQSVLITGSNMSGKTTLIRTVGLICILAYTGAKVPATSSSLSIMRVISSMRIIDSIEGNMSTFKAELVRIGNIVSAASENFPMLYLIDEIFRGTNSADRTDGAEAVLRKLNKPFISGFMTTHDYALCDRVTSKEGFENVTFYHFSEKYEGENIIFDYKLKDGISNESNAKFLMKLVGII